jgi:ketosteroid isomerase-like protein
MGAEENLELVRRWFATSAQGDPGVEFWHPECRIDNAEGWLIEVEYAGRDGVRKWWDDIAEAFADLRLLPIHQTPLDDERVLTEQRFEGTFRNTGLPFGPPWASIITIREGLLGHAIGFLDVDSGRRAAGLEVEAADEV